MDNKYYEVYKNIMSENPVIDKEYLNCILHLSGNQTVDFVEVTEVIESNTALVIKAAVQIKDLTKKLFIKTMKRNKSENVYHDMSMKEGKFYKFIKDNEINNLPVPLCYDAFVSEETGEFVIVLEDISSDYTAPDSAILQDKNIWFACAESLAKFHAAFWNHEIIARDDEESEHDAQSDRECLQSFLNDFKDKFDDKTKTKLKNAMEINISLINQISRRIREKKNVTICNGDSHIYNFMLPTERKNKPLMVDFQFWGEGLATGDLAHLTRVSFSDEFKKDIQIPLIEHYYKTLLSHGVADYSWEECFRDYRTNAATMVLIPLWQYSGFDLKYDEWSGDLQGLVYNFEYLKCDEL
jgi:hypothetical protein